MTAQSWSRLLGSRFGLACLTLLILFGQAARGADAYVLNLNFGSGSKTGLVEIASSQTVGNSTNDVWNLIGPSTLLTVTNLHLSTGSNTTVSVTITNLEWGPDTIYGHPDAMLGSYIRGNAWDWDNSAGVPASVVVSNLPAATYTVYCYGFGNDPSYEYELFNLNVGTNAYGQKQTAQAGPFDPVNDPMVEGRQYVVYTNVVVGAGQPMNFLLNQSFYNHTLNGIQIVSLDTTPTLPSVTFTPASGTGTPVSVTMAVSGHGDATIYYTTNGTTPTTSSYVYSSALSFEVATTVKAFATKSGYNDSGVSTATYPLSQLPLVTFNPADGASVPTNVVLSVTGHTNATIYYTTNGTTPTTNSTVYSGAIALNTNGWSYSANRVPTMTSYTTPSGSLVTNSSVYGTAYGWKAFDHSTSTYWTANGTGPEWVALTFPSARRVAKYALSSTTGGDAPKDWTLEGWNGSSYVVVDTRSAETNWNVLERREYVCTNSAAYSKYRLNVSAQNATAGNPSAYVIVAEVEMYEATITIQAFATLTNWMDSDLAYADYHALPQDQQQVAPTPFFSPNGGTFNNDTAVTISSPLSGATYQYTTNGTDWVTYSGAFTLDRNTTLRAKTSKTGYATSLERTNSYAFVVATPNISPNGGNFTNSVAVTLSSTTTGASFEYKIGAGSWQSYTGAFNITNTTVLTVAGERSNYGSSTNTASFTAVDTNSPPGQLLNINFGSGTKVGYAAVGNATNDVWNVIGASAASTNTGLMWANGGSTPVTVVVNNLESSSGNSHPDAMLSTFIYSYGYDGTPEVQISGLSSNVYDFYFLGLSDYPEGETVQFALEVNGSTTWSDATQTESDYGTAYGPIKEGTHFVALRNVVVPGGQTVKIRPYGGYSRSYINGLQVMLRGETALTLPNPKVTPASGTYTDVVGVTISNPWVGASNRYSVDNGSTWVTNSSVTLEASATLIAQSFRSGYAASGYTTNTYTINLPVAVSPGVTPAGDEYAEAKTLTIYSALAGAGYRYSTNNGSTWVTNNTVRLTNNATVLAQTVKYGYQPSVSVTNAYTINTNLTVVQGGLLNINFGSGTKIGYAATGLTTNDYWNVVGATVSAQSFTNPITTMKWWDTNTAGVTLVTSNLTAEGTSYHPDAMLNSYLYGYNYDGENGLGANVKISNLPAGTYDLYVHMMGGDPYSNHSGTSLETSTGTNTTKWGNPFYESIDGGTAFTEDLQYVVFTNVTVVAGSTVTFRMSTENTYTLNGIQVRNPSVSFTLPPVAFSPASGATVPTNVTMSVTGHADATIYYTTNGATPTTNSAVYSSAVSISTALTIKAFATKSGFEDAAQSSATYVLPTLPGVSFSPASGAVVPTNVVLSVSGHGDATIYYTTNGTTPTTSSTVYTSPLSLTAETTVKALASKTAYSNSPVTTASYILPTAPAPVISPTNGTYYIPLAVTASNSLSGATLLYSTNGTTWLTYAGAVSFYTNVMVRAKVTKSGYYDSAVTTNTYVLEEFPLPATTIEPNGGVFTNAASITLSNAIAGVLIEYRVGSNATWNAYSAPFSLDGIDQGSGVLLVRASKTNCITHLDTSDIFTFVATAPIYSHTNGTYTNAFSLTLTNSTAGSSMQYSYEGTDWTTYTGALTIDHNTTVYARTVKTGYISAGQVGHRSWEAFSSHQGLANWYYLYATEAGGLPDSFLPLYDTTNGVWRASANTNCVVSRLYQSASSTNDSVRSFQAPYDGSAIISGLAFQDDLTSTNNVWVRILKNDDTILDWVSVSADTPMVLTVVTNLVFGDEIHFQVSTDESGVSHRMNFYPTVAFQSQRTFLFTDTDGDGLSDAQETGISTDISNVDTDGDGVSDYVEWLLGRNPLVSGTTTDTGGVLRFKVYTPLE